jgi:L-fucose isomerase-like protein
MNVKVLPIVSKLHNDVKINLETKRLLEEIESLGDLNFQLSEITNFYDSELSLILIQSGGSESYFLEVEKELKEPYYLLTYGSNNSLAASMEILSYLKEKNKRAEILHGSASYIAKRISELKPKEVKKPVNLGVVGKPSDWLIASNVDYEQCLRLLNIRLVDIEISELIEIFNRVDIKGYENKMTLDFDQLEVMEAKKVSKALEALKKKYELEGLTLRCFDLLGKIHTTGCLGLSILNRNKSIGTCEGDIPTMLSMYFLRNITGQPGFQANPSSVDSDENEIVFAHCTLPLDMADTYETMTHFESGIGVAFRGKMKKTDVTIFKLSNNLKDYYVAEGSIIDNLEESNLCRTQIRIKLDDVKYFLTSPYGNHHIIVYGKHKDSIMKYMNNQLYLK